MDQYEIAQRQAMNATLGNLGNQTAPTSLAGTLRQCAHSLTKAEHIAGDILSAVIGPPPSSAPGTDVVVRGPTGLTETAIDLNERLGALVGRLSEIDRLLDHSNTFNTSDAKVLFGAGGIGGERLT